MIILPAIDIQGGECVRLLKGDFSTTEIVAENALTTAKGFEQAGAKWLHMVDLDGAKSGELVNSKIMIEVAKNTSLKVEVGGGIRNMQAVDYYIGKGISRVILGSAALHDPAFVKSAVLKYREKIAVGIDAKKGFVAIEGWLKESSVNYLDFAREMERIGVRNIIYTDISRDGTLSGPNLPQLALLHNAVSCNIIASGGVATISDIVDLRTIDVYGAICGKSLYKGTLDLQKAIRIAGMPPIE